MIANNGTGNCVERDEWETPIGLIDSLNKQYNFDLDCCATIKNKKAPFWTSDFLNKNCNGHKMAWMNPPFSKAEEMFKHFFKVIKRGIAIYRCDNMETNVWQNTILKNATWVFIPQRRIKYEGLDGSGSRFPSALIGFNVPIPKLQLGGVTLTPYHKGRGT